MNCPNLAWYAAMASLVGSLLAPTLAAEEHLASSNVVTAKAVDVALDCAAATLRASGHTER